MRLPSPPVCRLILTGLLLLPCLPCAAFDESDGNPRFGTTPEESIREQELAAVRAIESQSAPLEPEVRPLFELGSLVAGQIEVNDSGSLVVVSPDGTRQVVAGFGAIGDQIVDLLRVLEAESNALGEGELGEFYVVVDREEGTVTVLRTSDADPVPLSQLTPEQQNAELVGYLNLLEAKGGLEELDEDELLSLLALLAPRASRGDTFAVLLFARAYREFESRQSRFFPRQSLSAIGEILSGFVEENAAINAAVNQIIAEENAAAQQAQQQQARRQAPRQFPIFDFASNQWIYGDDYPNSLLLNQSPYCDPTALAPPLYGFSYNGQLGIHNSATGTTTKFP